VALKQPRVRHGFKWTTAVIEGEQRLFWQASGGH